MTVYRFADVAALQFLWLLPVLFVLSIYLLRHQARRIATALGSKMAPLLSASVSIPRRRWKLVLEVLALGCFILALARPQAGQSQQKVKSEGIEIVILFDVSHSMEAEDIKPSRLELAKKEVGRFLSRLSGDRVGLIAFAGSAIVLSPVTTDLSAIRMYVDSLTPESVGTQGTEFGKALREASQAFKRGGLEGDEEAVVTKAILVVSDGEDHEAGAMKVAADLAKDGVRIFALGVGTEKGGPIPVRDEFGNLRGYKKDEEGKVIMTQTKGTVLKELVNEGKGSFYHATFGGTAPESLYQDIRKLEQAQFNSAVITSYDEKYQGFLLLGLVFAFLELLIGERKRKARLWRGRFEVGQE
ncbi:MAG: VWA domain-containing protein [Bdellovibrionaceae bacterium]|nr:VWA domain-containing protein [Bdellovibrionales bacterium]MCB9084394.1 VWA domain-containing protein [Pseudobdellovibrionaceae bacterium]